MADKPTKAPRTLTDGDITTRRGLSRRSFLLGTFGGTTALAACMEVPASSGPVYTGLTDADGGAYADGAGYGRGSPRATGVTDADGGAYADAAGNGRGGRAYTGRTDSDGGAYADAAGYGRR